MDTLNGCLSCSQLGSELFYCKAENYFCCKVSSEFFCFWCQNNICNWAKINFYLPLGYNLFFMLADKLFLLFNLSRCWLQIKLLLSFSCCAVAVNEIWTYLAANQNCVIHWLTVVLLEHDWCLGYFFRNCVVIG